MKSGICRLFFSFFLFASCVNKTHSQKEEDTFEEKINKLVISENKMRQEYFFKVMLVKEVLEYRITYLGKIKTRQGNELKFLNNTIYAGLYEDSKRASTTVNIYDSDNKRIGFYYVGGPMDAPSRLEGSNLIFSFNNEECNQTTSINFSDSIPQQIFVSCTKNGGNLWTFEKED